jgi:hypothetical protein
MPENFLVWNPIVNPWDVVFLNGFALPGVSKVEVSGARKLDVKQSAGRHFSTVTDMGYKPIDVIVTTTIWTPQQWIDWQLNILPMIEPLPNATYSKKPDSYNIVHPATQSRGVQAICIETLTGPHPSHLGWSAREFKIKAIQWSKAFQASATNTVKGGAINPQSNAQTGNKNKPSKIKVPAAPNPFPTAPVHD